MKSKNNSSFFFICRSFSLLLTVSLPLQPVWLYANPSGEQVVAGSASFHRNGSSLSIHQFSNRAIINWQDFSIALGELTEFLQPSRSSAVLNRVVGGNISEIYGTLKANGSVFLINPNGVLIGPSGIIEVGSFVASTRDVSNEEFLQGGPLNFTGNSTAELVNLGRISAQDDVYLMAEAVRNEGHITAGREVGLAAGGAFYLQEQGEERFKVKLPHNGSAKDTGVLNTGQIEAARATLQATGSAYSVAVNNGGTIRATGVQRTPEGRVFLVGSGGGSVLNTGSISARNADGSGGKVKLAAGEGTLRHSGQVEVTGTTGGRAELTGERVAVTGRVDASGQQGGGRIYVGGSYQGREEPEIANAQRTLVGTTGELRADALESGDGGRIIVWADGDTAFHGTLSARGGLLGGNGGFAEISGKEALTLTGSTDLSAPLGQVGTLLLDPKNIWVVAAHASPVGLTLVDDFNDAGTDNYILAGTITGAASNVTLQATNDIYFNAGVTMGARNLTLQAGRSILIGDTTLPHVTISFTTGNFTATINDQNAVAGIPPHSRDAGLAEFRLQNATVQYTGGGSFTVNSGTFDPAGGTIRFLGGTGVNQYARVLNAGQINLTCQDDIVLQGGSANSTFALLQTAGASGSINLTSTNGNIDVLGSTAAANQSAYALINSSGTLDMQAVNGRIRVQGGAGAGTSAANSNYARALATGAVTLAAGTQGLEVLGGTGPFSYAQVQGSGVTLTQSGGIQVIGGSGASATASITGAAGGVQLNSTGNIMLQGGSANLTFAQINTTGGGNISLTSTNGNIDLLGSTTLTNNNAYALINSSGTLNMQAVNGRIRLLGGAGNGATAANSNYARALATGAVTLAAGTQGLEVLGGTGPFSYAQVQGSGVTLTQSGGIQVIGGSGASATASITGAAGGVQLNSTGNIMLQGGSANLTFAQINTTGGGNISLTSTNGNIDLLGSTTLTNNNAYALINSSGTLNMQAVNGRIRLLGGAGNGATAANSNYARALATGAVTLAAGTQGLEVLGGTGPFSYAQVQGGGVNLVQAGSVQVTGGTGQDTSASISGGAGGVQLNSTGDIDITGGSANNTSALVATTAGGGNISLISTNGNINIQGGLTPGTIAARADINSVGNVNLQATNGRILIRGGDGAGTAFGNGNGARLITPTGSITLNAGSQGIEIRGHTGSFGYAQISAGAGGVLLNSVGDIVMEGGTGNNAFSQIITTGSGNISLTSTNGNIDILGSTSATNLASYAWINCNGNLDLSATSGRVRMRGGNGVGTTTANSNYVRANALGAINITAGAGGFELIGGGGNFSRAEINGGSGALQINSVGDVLIQGGTNNNTLAQITNPGSGADISIVSTAGNIDVLGDPTPNSYIFHYAQINSSGNLNLQASNGRIRFRGGDGAGTLTSNSSFARAQSLGTMTVNAGAPGVELLGGTGNLSYAELQGGAGGILINSFGDIVLTGGSGNSTYATVRTLNGGNISLNSSSGNIDVLGSMAAANQSAYALINSVGTLGMQANNGRIRVQGGAGAGTSAANSNYALVLAAGAATLVAGSPGLEVLGGTGPFSYAHVTTTSGDLSLASAGIVNILGGSSVGGFARIYSGGNLTSNVTSHLRLEAGSANTTYALLGSAGQQNITVGGNVDILGTSDPSTTQNTTAMIAILDSSTASQFLTVGGNLTMEARHGRYSGGVAAAFCLSNIPYGAAVVNAGHQNVQVGGNLLILGGDSPGTNCKISSERAGYTQTVNVSGNARIEGGTSTNDAFAEIVAIRSTQQTVTVGGNLEILGGTGVGSGFVRQGGIYNAAIGGGFSGNQNVTASSILLNARDAYHNLGQGGAFICNEGVGLQTVTTTTGDIVALGGSKNNGYASIWANNGNQLVSSAGNITLTAGSGQASYARIRTTGGNQNVLATGDIQMTGGTGNFAWALIENFSPAFTQTVNANGNITLIGGNGFNANAAITSNVTNQSISSNNNISLIGGTNQSSAEIYNFGANATQTVTAANQLNLTGTGAGEYAIVYGNTGITTLNFTTGTWSNEAYVSRSTFAGTVIINNSGQLTINEQPGRFGYVRADTVEFQGAGTVGSNLNGAGSANTRLNTDVNHIFFNDAAKTLYLSEIDSSTTGGVTIRGIANHVDLITDTTGDILQGSSNFTAQSATLRTADGNIYLNDPTNSVGTFQGLIANNGFINYSGLGTTTFAARAVSAEVPLVPDLTTGINNVGVFATGDITLSNPTGTFIVTTDEVRSDTGNVDITADLLRFNAASASTGGIHGPSGAEGWVYTPQGTQTYNVSSNIQLLRNTHMRADSFPNDTITFNGDIISPGGVAGLQVGSSPVFNGANVGTVPNPLAYLLFSNNAPSTITFTPNFNTAVINFSLINQNDAQMLINAATPTFIVDHGTVGPGPGLFQGGNMTVAGPLQIFGAIPAQVTGNIGGLSPQLYTGQEFWAAWLGNPFTPQIPLPSFPSSFVAYKIPLPGGGGGGGGLGLGLSLEFLARDAWQDEDDNGGDRRRNPYRNQFKFLYQDRARATPAVLAGASSYQLYKEQLFERSELTHLIQQVERKKGEEVKLMNY